MAAESLVELRTVGSGLRRAELEVALVGIFVAAGVKPGIQVRIRDGFFSLVGDDIAHAVSAAHASRRAVGAGALDFAAAGALVSVADECPLDVGAIDRLMGMEAAELSAESALFDIRRSQEQVNAVRISR